MEILQKSRMVARVCMCRAFRCVCNHSLSMLSSSSRCVKEEEHWNVRTLLLTKQQKQSSKPCHTFTYQQTQHTDTHTHINKPLLWLACIAKGRKKFKRWKSEVIRNNGKRPHTEKAECSSPLYDRHVPGVPWQDSPPHSLHFIPVQKQDICCSDQQNKPQAPHTHLDTQHFQLKEEILKWHFLSCLC